MKKKIHYAWIVFASCILLKIGLGGVVMCIAGNFVTPVVQEFGCSVSAFTMLVSVEAAAMALMYTTAAKTIAKGHVGKVMGIASLAQVIGIGLMATYKSVFPFYISGAIVGVGVAFTGYVAIPVVVNMWFKKKAGTILGIIIAAENIAMILYTKLSAVLITAFGWRGAYGILATICLVVSVPAVFFLIKSPEEVGVQPYGAVEATADSPAAAASEWGFTRKQALKMPLFYIVWFTCMLYSVGCGVQQYIANFATMELGKSIDFGANAAMLMSCGCVICSVCLGYINDKFGVKAGLIWGFVFIALGFGTMIASIGNPMLCMLASFLVGLGGSMYTVQCPLLAKTALGEKDYSSIWSLMMMGNSMVGALSFSSIGLFYDVGGSYVGAFLMAICLYGAAVLIGAFALNKSKQLRKTQI